MKAYKVIFEIYTEKNKKPIYRTYAFSTGGGKQIAMKIALDIITDYIVDMGFYTGSVHKISEIKSI